MTTLTPALRLPALGVAPAVRREAATQAFARDPGTGRRRDRMLEPRASRTATAIGIGDPKQIGSG
jgi:hypothetical protein